METIWDTPVISKSISPSPSSNSFPVLGGEELEFESYYYSPYRVQIEDDDDAPLTKRNLRDLNEKLDKLLASSSSSSTSTYSDTVVRALIETTLKQHDESIQKAPKVVYASFLSCKKTSEDVATLISDAKLLLESLKKAAESNTNKVNTAIESLSNSLQAEKDKFDSM
ncbi:hypothetical protein Lser_V15G38227 [Lactuca serriola]